MSGFDNECDDAEAAVGGSGLFAEEATHGLTDAGAFVLALVHVRASALWAVASWSIRRRPVRGVGQASRTAGLSLVLDGVGELGEDLVAETVDVAIP
ncbi:hypothetical protein [Streptomyces sp. NPDC001933]|uniref:hypothetical protein n=1 Tax=Streptomyces sp. NPDC001933 TaxID=3364626 RepID=UPI0036750167